ncbi:MAG: hypothetical protein ACR2MA_10690 [Egibacteraceae bacterium]
MTRTDAPPTVEAAWERLWAQLKLSEGFWLGYHFTSDVGAVRELQERSRRVLRGEARGVEARQVNNPNDLLEALPWLLRSRSAATGVVWLVGVSGDFRGWISAWGGLLRRLNERRDTLPVALPCGLVLVAPRPVLPVARDTAADLWSLRSFLAEVRMGTAQHTQPFREPPVARSGEDHGDGAFAARALSPSAEPSATLRPLLRQVGVDLTAGRPDLAIERARDALDRAGTTMTRRWPMRGSRAVVR